MAHHFHKCMRGRCSPKSNLGLFREAFETNYKATGILRVRTIFNGPLKCFGLHRLRLELLNDNELDFGFFAVVRFVQLQGDEILPKVEEFHRLGFVESSGEEDGGADSRTSGCGRYRHNLKRVGRHLEDLEAHFGRVVLVGD